MPSDPFELSDFFAAAQIDSAESAEKLENTLKTHPEWGCERDADASNFTALTLAAAKGAAKCVTALLPFSEANAKGSDGATALMRAAGGGHVECVKALLPASDANLRDEDGATALMWAAGGGHVECVKALLPASDASLRDDGGATALIWAAQTAPECVRALLPVSDACAANKDGETALMWAAMQGWLESVKAIAPLADVKAQSNAEDDALGYAEHWGHWHCADYLAAIMSPEDAEGLKNRAPTNTRLPFCDALLEREALKKEVSNADILAHASERSALEELSEPRSPSRRGVRRM